MLQMTYPIQADGLKVPVLLGLNHQAMTALVSAGRPLPPPLCVTATFDTGSNVTCVGDHLLARLGISPLGQTYTQTASGQASVRLFEVSLSIPQFGNPPGSLLLGSQLVVMELAPPIPGVEVLLGLDVLLTGKLFLDGPARLFAVEF
jgi:hypothetical protein